MVSVIVDGNASPGRLEECIESLRSQDYPHFEILLAVPEAEAASLRWLERPESSNGRLRIVPSRGDGVPGAEHAARLRQAVQSARGSWLTFADGHSVHRPSCLTTVVRDALQHRTDLLAVLPAVHCRSAAQAGLLRLAAAWIVPASRWLDPSRRPGEEAILSCRALVLVRRVSYEEVGGHGPAEAPFLSTNGLAAKFRSAGLRVRAARGAKLWSIVLDESNGAAVEAGRRFLTKFAAGSAGRVAAVGLGAAASAIVPWLSLTASLIVWAMSGSSDFVQAAVVTTFVGAALQLALDQRVTRPMRLPARWLPVRLPGLALSIRAFGAWAVFRPATPKEATSAASATESPAEHVSVP